MKSDNMKQTKTLLENVKRLKYYCHTFWFTSFYHMLTNVFVSPKRNQCMKTTNKVCKYESIFSYN